MEQLSLSFSEARVPHTASQASEKDWMTLEGSSCSNALQHAAVSILSGQSSRTSPVFFPLTEDGISRPSSMRWLSCGLGGASLGGFWTLSGSESPKDADVCSLSSILETGDVPQRYYLTSIACEGILRRAKKRGKPLPPMLEQALISQMGNSPTS